MFFFWLEPFPVFERRLWDRVDVHRSLLPFYETLDRCTDSGSNIRTNSNSAINSWSNKCTIYIRWKKRREETLVELKVIVIHWLFPISDSLPGHSPFVFLFIFWQGYSIRKKLIDRARPTSKQTIGERERSD